MSIAKNAREMHKKCFESLGFEKNVVKLPRCVRIMSQWNTWVATNIDEGESLYLNNVPTI